MSTALATIETLTAVQVFVEGDPAEIISKLEREIRSRPAADMTVKADREETRSLAAKIARTKTGLDDLGKDFVADLKKQTSAVDAKRKLIRDRLDALKDEVRSPLTAWEDAETARVDAHERALIALIEARNLPAGTSASDIRRAILAVETSADRDWQEFSERAAEAFAATIAELHTRRDAAEQAERDAAELAELRRLKAEREEQDRVAALAEAAAARAVEDERRRVAAIEAAAEAERQRLAAMKAAEDAAERKRQENKKHRAKINNEIKVVLAANLPITTEVAEAIVVMLAKGAIPHTKIEY